MKNIGRYAFILASAATLVACGNGDDAPDTSGKTQVRFATWDNEESLDTQQTLVDEFNSSQDEIEVILEAYGGDFDTKITAGLGAGDAPDVMYMWNYPLYHEGLESLDSYIDSEGADYRDNFYETTWNYNSIGEEVYGIPVGFTTHALYYNKDVFDAAGIDYPTVDWTWDDVEEASREIANSGDNVYGFAFQGNPDPYDEEMYLWSNGTAYVDDEGNADGYVNSDASIEVFTKFQNMIIDEIAIASEGDGRDELAAGTAGMMINGAWAINTLTSQEVNFGVIEQPRFGSNDSISVLSSSGLAMSADSENKDAAWEFIKFWTNEEANLSRIDFELPVLKSVVEETNLENDEIKAPFYTMLERSQDYTPTSFKIDGWNQFSGDLSLAFEQIFNPTTLTNPQEALDSVVNNR